VLITETTPLVENKTKVIAPASEPVASEGDRRSSGLVRGVPLLEAFAGWGPRLEGSVRDVLRGLN
jgi:hypothetical protein